MVRTEFDFTGIPEIIFAIGAFDRLPDLITERGKRVLLVTGGSSLRESGYFEQLVGELDVRDVKVHDVLVEGEPSPDLVDKIVAQYREQEPEVVVSIGGGSVMDTGKAVAAMIPGGGSVMRYLEGVGEGKGHSGDKLPFIAAPTTSGTGSEATKNAVLSRVGPEGFKKSLRHDNFIPDIALLDPELVVSCPQDITAASGLDAMTQLMGAYLSTEAAIFTDSLLEPALKMAGRALIPLCTDQPDNLDFRADMAYAALISGIGLANAGLGIVHGLAGPVGGFFDIPHGVVCGTLFGEAVKLNLELLQGEKDGNRYLEKYAWIGACWAGREEVFYQEENIDLGCQLLVETIEDWLDRLKIPRLGEYGVKEEDLDKIVDRGGNKNNPVQLNREQMKELLRRRL